MKNENRIPEQFLKALAAIETVIAASPVNDDGSPVLSGDYDSKQMSSILGDHTRMLKACYACMHSMADVMYGHIYDPMHIPSTKNYDHKAYACKQLGFDKEDAVRRAAYASRKETIIVG